MVFDHHEETVEHILDNVLGAESEAGTGRRSDERERPGGTGYELVEEQEDDDDYEARRDHIAEHAAQ